MSRRERLFEVAEHVLQHGRLPPRGVAMVASAVMDRESRAELLAHIGDYAGGRVPLVVPLTLFVHHIRRCGVPYLADQVYLRPHPVELMLSNHV